MEALRISLHQLLPLCTTCSSRTLFDTRHGLLGRRLVLKPLDGIGGRARKAAIIFSQSDCLQTAVHEDRRESCAKTKTRERELHTGIAENCRE